MFTFGLLCFTSFFTLINPLGAMPVFMTMTMELDEKERRKVARRASLVSFLIMMFFAISVNGINKFDDGVTIFFTEFAELVNAPACVTI